MGEMTWGDVREWEPDSSGGLKLWEWEWEPNSLVDSGLGDVLVDITTIIIIIIIYCILGCNPQPKILGSPDPLEIGHLKLIGADHGLHASGGVQNDGLARLLGLV